jgi:hypothetical protein
MWKRQFKLSLNEIHWKDEINWKYFSVEHFGQVQIKITSKLRKFSWTGETNICRISYIKMKVCMYVCMCVCPAACRRTHTSHHPEIWHGLLISPGLGTEPGGDPKC